jgi:RNA polymerase sigma-70 factor (ECF subfamily)
MRLLVPLLAVLLMAFAPAPLPKANRGGPNADLKALQGSWETVSLNLTGAKVDRTPGIDVTVFAGRHVSCVVSGKIATEWTLLLDPAATPKVLDLRNKRGQVLRGIYHLEGDTLTLCYRNELDGARPADFRPGKGVGLEVLRRARR